MASRIHFSEVACFTRAEVIAFLEVMFATSGVLEAGGNSLHAQALMDVAEAMELGLAERGS